MKCYYDIYRGEELLYRAMTPTQAHEAIGIPNRHVRLYAENEYRYKRIYKVVFNDGRDILSIAERRKHVETEWQQDFKCQWQQAVAPFKKVKWSRSRGKKLKVEAHYEEENNG